MKGQGTGDRDHHLANKCRQTQSLACSLYLRGTGAGPRDKRAAFSAPLAPVRSVCTLLGDDIPRSHLSADAVLWGLGRGHEDRRGGTG